MAYTGSGTQADPYLVGTIDDLAAVITGSGPVYIKMLNDLDFTGRSSIPTSMTNGRSLVYIDGNNTKWTNIALINATLFKNPNNIGYELFTINNLDIEYMQVYNNRNAVVSITGSTGHASAVWISNHNAGLVLTDCIIKAKLYYAVFANDYFSMGMIFGSEPIQGVTQDIILRCDIVVDFYYIGTNASLHLNCWSTSVSNDHYIRDSIIKISYYDENGWACRQGFWGNFCDQNDLDQISYSGHTPLPLIGNAEMNEYYYKGNTIVNSGIFVRYYADVNMNNKVTMSIIRYIEMINSYIVYECMKSVYLKPDIRKTKFSTYSFYDIDKAPTIFLHSNTYSYDSSQFRGLTTAQCKARSSFEGPDAIIPFKLKQPSS